MTSAALKNFDVSQLPSVKAGMTAKEETIRRRKTCRFIEEAGRILKLPRVANATAMVFFHRFYAKHSFMEHDRFEVAVASILLAAKTEEAPKKLNEIVAKCLELKSTGVSNAGKGAGPVIDPKSEEFAKRKERILLLERVVLHTIGFELSIDHPYKFLVEIIKKLTHTRQLEYKNPQSSSKTSSMNNMLNDLVKYSMCFANDSVHTSLCLQFSPQLIATACVYLAGHFANVQPTNNKKTWLEVLACPPNQAEAVSSICGQIIELIVDRRGTDVDAFKEIRANLGRLKGVEGATRTPSAANTPTKAAPPTPKQPPRGPPADESASKRQRTS
ncbi:Cyclin [Seminavis robusta]|uniref:Cyclin n=1 Tax=Seminavis robusta TaxID=568900 RepID=A0A9N8DGL6_9STRA|nr:Cyclin [Seminavis robusta]|eukprot:Sro82_g043790.1 Cyclin (330) ;mRNA; f:38590-39729